MGFGLALGTALGGAVEGYNAGVRTRAVEDANARENEKWSYEKDKLERNKKASDDLRTAFESANSEKADSLNPQGISSPSGQPGSQPAPTSTAGAGNQPAGIAAPGANAGGSAPAAGSGTTPQANAQPTLHKATDVDGMTEDQKKSAMNQIFPKNVNSVAADNRYLDRMGEALTKYYMATDPSQVIDVQNKIETMKKTRYDERHRMAIAQIMQGNAAGFDTLNQLSGALSNGTGSTFDTKSAKYDPKNHNWTINTVSPNGQVTPQNFDADGMIKLGLSTSAAGLAEYMVKKTTADASMMNAKTNAYLAPHQANNYDATAEYHRNRSNIDKADANAKAKADAELKEDKTLAAEIGYQPLSSEKFEFLSPDAKRGYMAKEKEFQYTKQVKHLNDGITNSEARAAVNAAAQNPKNIQTDPQTGAGFVEIVVGNNKTKRIQVTGGVAPQTAQAPAK